MATSVSDALPLEERTYLRELARKQAGYAALPVMERRAVEGARRQIDRIHGSRT